MSTAAFAWSRAWRLTSPWSKSAFCRCSSSRASCSCASCAARVASLLDTLASCFSGSTCASAAPAATRWPERTRMRVTMPSTCGLIALVCRDRKVADVLGRPVHRFGLEHGHDHGHRRRRPRPAGLRRPGRCCRRTQGTAPATTREDARARTHHGRSPRGDGRNSCDNCGNLPRYRLIACRCGRSLRRPARSPAARRPPTMSRAAPAPRAAARSACPARPRRARPRD